jgi:hypothetical protein
MQVRALAKTPPLETVTLHSGVGALVLWLAVLANEWPRLTALGRICGEPRALLGHCPLCWPAAVLTAVALAGAVLLASRGPGRA